MWRQSNRYYSSFVTQRNDVKLPIAFASRSLATAAQNYSQLEFIGLSTNVLTTFLLGNSLWLHIIVRCIIFSTRKISCQPYSPVSSAMQYLWYHLITLSPIGSQRSVPMLIFFLEYLWNRSREESDWAEIDELNYQVINQIQRKSIVTHLPKRHRKTVSLRSWKKNECRKERQSRIQSPKLCHFQRVTGQYSRKTVPRNFESAASYSSWYQQNEGTFSQILSAGHG